MPLALKYSSHKSFNHHDAEESDWIQRTSSALLWQYCVSALCFKYCHLSFCGATVVWNHSLLTSKEKKENLCLLLQLESLKWSSTASRNLLHAAHFWCSISFNHWGSLSLMCLTVWRRLQGNKLKQADQCWVIPPSSERKIYCCSLEVGVSLKTNVSLFGRLTSNCSCWTTETNTDSDTAVCAPSCCFRPSGRRRLVYFVGQGV